MPSVHVPRRWFLLCVGAWAMACGRAHEDWGRDASTDSGAHEGGDDDDGGTRSSAGSSDDDTSGASDEHGGDSTGADVPCPPLADRLVTTVVPATAGASPIHLAPRPDGGAVLGWSTTEGTIEGRIAVLDEALAPTSIDVVLPQVLSIRGVVAREREIAAVTVALADLEATLVRFTAEGVAIGETSLVGGGAIEREGDRRISPWFPTSGRLFWSGDAYAVYFALERHFGDKGVHQGEFFAVLDGDGTVQDGWEFHCSHSLAERLAYGDAGWMTVCLSDAYPAPAIVETRAPSSVIHDEPSGDGAGYSSAQLGGLVAIDGGFLLSFASREGRPGDLHDIGLARIDGEGVLVDTAWITETEDRDETLPHLARYGTRVLVSWSDEPAMQPRDGTLALAVVTQDARIVEGPALVHATSTDTDFLALADGDVAWPTPDTELGIAVHRVDLCE